ncbi:hypothetical protein QTH97_08440 [Variovorax sp. J22R24]|uniref:hypothetical protein n=1 Tax=Variovorax gracilis TaxID=3053502 RepID=UPI002577B624|nr:hypothetical protein [Variovorax sp. J22R24]MDM0104959.1 hypothetical protein [Variovorax sp. J22R24]
MSAVIGEPERMHGADVEEESPVEAVDRGSGGRGSSARRRSKPDSGDSAGFSIASLSWLAAGSGIVALLLFSLQKALKLPSGFGIEDLMGWKNALTVLEAVRNWCPPISERWPAAAAYVLVDTALFMPLYGALILAAARGLGGALQKGRLKLVLQPVSWILVIVLWLVDGIENFGGAERIGVSRWAFFVSALIAVILFAMFWRTVKASQREQKRTVCLNTTALLAAMAILGLVVLVQGKSVACGALADSNSVVYGFTAWAHDVKPIAVLLALMPITVAAVVWWFGMDLDLHDALQEEMSECRAAWRSGVMGVIGRTRYILALLGLFAAFTLVLDQCRDVLLALAGPRGSQTEPSPPGSGAWSVAVLIVGAISVGMLAYSCWLWTRLVGMVERPGLALPGGKDVRTQVGEFARGWARAMSLVPLVMFCVLVAHTAGDAGAAARAGRGTLADSGLFETFVYLGLFATAAIVSGFAFLELRRKLSLKDSGDYYNSESDVYMLLRTGTIIKRRQDDDGAAGLGAAVVDPASPGCLHAIRSKLAPFFRTLQPVARLFRPLIPLSRPIGLPLVALALMLLLRACMAWWPDTTSQAPATFALLCLALVWWMGVAGAISLAEQRQTIPWGLAILGVVGVLGLLKLVDNHVMPLNTLAGASDTTLATLRNNGLTVTVLLCAMSVVLWFVLLYRPATSREDPKVRAWRPNERLRRSLLAVVVVAGVGGGLHFVDRDTQPLLRSTDPIRTDRTLDRVVAERASSLKDVVPTEADHRVYLVASEGGGIRAAYWTALILAKLHDRPAAASFDSRTVVLSGVSGGAVGEAVYIACLREMPPGHPVGPCVKTRFARLDALSPLLGAMLFEDVFARILPLYRAGGPSICGQPGCGYLSRALGFEREWMRQFPALADSLAPSSAKQGEPELMLNSTWVESGNRATLSTMRLPPRDTPASQDVIAEAGSQPSLITAAHAAARFPFINPLGALQPVQAQDRRGAAEVIGHLADGGYHDNSGAESLSDVFRALRDKLPSGWKPQLVLIRNGQIKPRCEKQGSREPEPRCLTKNVRADDADLATPQKSASWGLYVDLLGPPVTLLNVSGIGARGRQAVAAMGADLAPMRPWLLDQTTEVTLVPLGWYLSPAARKALDHQAECVVTPDQPDCAASRPRTDVNGSG